MTTTETTTPPHANHDRAEEVAIAGLGLGIVARAGARTLAHRAGLRFCPPLLILAVAVIVPTLILVVLAGLIYALCAAPILLVRRVREHHRTHQSSALAHGVRSLRARYA
jgi:hypothetical protein